MAILLKTASLRVSSIQIMQIRVQNKGKRVWKSRYDGEVSTPPSLKPCLSSSNSVDKLNEKGKIGEGDALVQIVDYLEIDCFHDIDHLMDTSHAMSSS